MLLQPAIGVKLHRDGECLKINYNAASKLAALADVPDKDVCEVWPYQENTSLKFSLYKQDTTATDASREMVFQLLIYFFW